MSEAPFLPEGVTEDGEIVSKSRSWTFESMPGCVYNVIEYLGRGRARVRCDCGCSRGEAIVTWDES